MYRGTSNHTPEQWRKFEQVAQGVDLRQPEIKVWASVYRVCKNGRKILKSSEFTIWPLAEKMAADARGNDFRTFISGNGAGGQVNATEITTPEQQSNYINGERGQVTCTCTRNMQWIDTRCGAITHKRKHPQHTVIFTPWRNGAEKEII